MRYRHSGNPLATRRGNRARDARRARCSSRQRKSRDERRPGSRGAIRPRHISTRNHRSFGSRRSRSRQARDRPSRRRSAPGREHIPRPAPRRCSASCAPPLRGGCRQGAIISTPTEEPSFSGFTTYGRRQRVGGFEFVDLDDAAMRDREARGGENGTGRRLVHRQRRRANARMRVGNAKPVEHALDRAILSEAAVQRVEHRRPASDRARR